MKYGRFIVLRSQPGSKFAGFGYVGCDGTNDGFFLVETYMRQIVWRVPATKWTRAFAGGAALGPARTWFHVEADTPGKFCLTLHAYLLGSFRFGYYPLNNQVKPQCDL